MAEHSVRPDTMADATPTSVQEAIESAAREVFDVLGGPGFTEAIYQNALKVELEVRGVKVDAEVPVPIVYKGRNVGVGRMDLVVVDPVGVIVELKAVQRLTPAAEQQLKGYMRVNGTENGVLVNFGGSAVECKRVSI